VTEDRGPDRTLEPERLCRAAMASPVIGGYVTAGTDTGHTGNTAAFATAAVSLSPRCQLHGRRQPGRAASFTCKAP
jgi:hypothetical protein